MGKEEIIQVLIELEKHLNYTSDEFARYWNELNPDAEPITWGDIKYAKLGEAIATIHYILNQ